MEVIIHRVNSILSLKSIPNAYGCEVDLRANGSSIVMNHDPYVGGENFLSFLEEYNHGTLVLNIKESGIEDYVLKAVKDRGIKSFFLLDVEFPFIYNHSLIGNMRNVAARFSEYEPIKNLEIFKNKIDWVWIDTFTKNPVNEKNLQLLNNFKKCLVCPSRWGRFEDILHYRRSLNQLNFNLDSVMTDIKFSELWSQELKD